jgi:TatD DNase family protein
VLVDSHCHLDSRAFDRDRDDVIQRAREAGVSLMMAIGTGDGPPDLEAAIRIAEAHPDITATVGVHPHDARKFDDRTAARLERLCAHADVVAVGEIGLDYHYENSPRGIQERVFVTQMEIAAARGMPIAIHTRDAWDDTLDLLKRHWSGTGIRGIMHCFTGTSEQALRCLDMGFLLSFSGVLTFSRSAELRATARWTPIDALLVETDAPYLTPAPHRKIRRNEPRFLVETARLLAEVKGVEFEELAYRTGANYRMLVGLEPPA